MQNKNYRTEVHNVVGTSDLSAYSKENDKDDLCESKHKKRLEARIDQISNNEVKIITKNNMRASEMDEDGFDFDYRIKVNEKVVEEGTEHYDPGDNKKKEIMELDLSEVERSPWDMVFEYGNGRKSRFVIDLDDMFERFSGDSIYKTVSASFKDSEYKKDMLVHRKAAVNCYYDHRESEVELDIYNFVPGRWVKFRLKVLQDGEEVYNEKVKLPNGENYNKTVELDEEGGVDVELDHVNDNDNFNIEVNPLVKNTTVDNGDVKIEELEQLNVPVEGNNLELKAHLVNQNDEEVSGELILDSDYSSTSKEVTVEDSEEVTVELETEKGLYLSSSETQPSLHVSREYDSPTTTFFRSGKYTIRAGSVDGIHYENDWVLEEMIEHGILDSPDTAKDNFYVHNILSMCELDLEEYEEDILAVKYNVPEDEYILEVGILSVNLGLENTEYDPDRFPGMIYDNNEKYDNCKLIIFGSGKIIQVGSNKLDEVERNFEKFIEEDFKELANEDPSTL